MLTEVLVKEYANKKLLIIGILNGSFMLVSDLSKGLWRKKLYDFEIDFIGVSSYGTQRSSSRKPILTKDIRIPVTKKHVLIVEDVIETGHSLRFVYDFIAKKNPDSLKTLVLVSKRGKQEVSFKPDFIGFEIEGNIWIEGYGLDTSGMGRGSPDILQRK